MVAFLALGLITVVGIPWLALRGKSRRGVYLAISLVAAVLAFACNEMMTTPLPFDPTPADIAGNDYMIDNGPPFIVWMGATVIASLIGAAVYRNSEVGLKACPHCAERIQAAAAVCRFCGRSVDAPEKP